MPTKKDMLPACVHVTGSTVEDVLAALSGKNGQMLDSMSISPITNRIGLGANALGDFSDGAIFRRVL
jgi:hypothetical protein